MEHDNSKDIYGLKEKMDLLIHNPALMQRYALMHLSDVMGGKNYPVDPTSPFMQLMEASVTSASAAVDHQLVNLSKRYPVLANNETDLYEHMSDDDYNNRFVLPASGLFTFLMPVDSLLNSVIPSSTGVYDYVSIPLDTQVVVDDITYSFKNSIELRVHRNSVIKVVSMPNEDNDDLETNIIESEELYDNNRVALLTFNIELVQLKKLRAVRTILESATFREEFDFAEGFHSIGVYYRGMERNWTKLAFSHSDQTFDESVPKAIVKVLDSKVYVYIPPIYTVDQRMGGEIQIVIMTSTGAIDIDYADIKREFFETNIDDIDSELTEGDVAFTQTSYMIYSTDHIVGGRDPLSFDELKKRTITNNIGVNVLPITPTHFITNAENYGYSAVRHIDTLTGRVYTMSSPIPTGKNLNIETEPDVGFIQLMESVDSLSKYGTVKDNGNSVTILPTTLYEVDQQNVRILRREVVEAYVDMEPTARVNTFNTLEYRYSPYFYVLTQNRDILECEIYQLDVPKVEYISFLDQNKSVEIYLNQLGIRVDYNENYYKVVTYVEQEDRLDTVTKNELYGQISYIDTVTGSRVYIESHDVEDYQDGFVITFILETNLHIVDDTIGITNSIRSTGVVEKSYMPISVDLNITYGTMTFPAGYVQTSMDSITLNRDYARRYPLTLELANVTFGKNLTYLWRDVRPVGTKVQYIRAVTDIPMIYEEDIYNGEPEFRVNADCTIDVDVIHSKGDVVKDSYGNVVYKYLRGDILLDEIGNPRILGYTEYSYYIDVFVFDGVYFTITDDHLNTHLQWIYDHIVKQSTINMAPLQLTKLEHTDLMYKPRDSLSICEVFTSKFDKQWIQKRTFINIIINVEESIYKNIAARKIIEHTTFEVVNSNLRKQTISHDVITDELKKAYQLGVISVSIQPTEGAGKIPSCTLRDESNRISLRKEMFITPAGIVSVQEDIAIDFVNYTVK